jgi:hypothetical protein
MLKTGKVKERVESISKFTKWSKNRDLRFQFVGNKWKADLLFEEDEVMILSSEDIPTLLLKDYTEDNVIGETKYFEVERTFFMNKNFRVIDSIELIQIDSVNNEDIKASFRFNNSVPINNITISCVEFNGLSDSHRYYDRHLKKWINEEVKIDTKVFAETAICIDLNNGKSIYIRFIDAFDLYFAAIGKKENIIKRLGIGGYLNVSSKNTSKKTEKTIYNTA